MNYKITLFFALILVFFTETNAQTLLQFKSKEGLTFANTEAKKSSTNPKLRSIASISGTFSGQTLTFDISNGKSTIWVYVFQDGTNKDSIIAVPLLYVSVFTINNFVNAKSIITNFSVKDYLKFLPSSLFTTPTSNWIESDQMCTDVIKQQSYISFIAKNPNEKPTLIGLGNNELNPALKMGDPYWTITIGTAGTKTSLNCSVQAITRETSCLALADVKEEFANNNPAFPNPANSFVYFSVPENFISDDSNLELYSNDGNKILENRIFKADGTNFNLPTGFLSNGTYYIKVGNSKLNFVQKFVVNR